MTLQTGQILQSRYQIIKSLGKGGMGAVYLAQDARLGRKSVAIKEFDPSILPPQDRQWAATAFTREAHMLAQLKHPALTAVSDYFAEQHLLYLVMDYVEGETLQKAWSRQPHNRFDPQQVMVWARQSCDVLTYLHSQNPPVIFRDLKPSNIMVMPDGQIKLIDFGIARYFRPGQTRDTVALGTPGYSAPEQHGQEQVDARSDIYALGVVLHQLLTGYDPTSAPFTLPPIRTLASHVPPQMIQAIEKALKLDRTQRPTSAQAFYNQLQRQAQKPPNRVWTNLVWGIAAVLLVIIGGGLGMWAIRGGLGATPIPTPVAEANAKVVATNTFASTPLSPTDKPEDIEAVPDTPVTGTLPVATEPVGTEVVIAEITAVPIMPVCTPPACSDNEVYFCSDDCPGGCGTMCVTITPTALPFTEDWELARSAGGRSIPVTRLGSGPRKIVLIGTVRGGESPNSEVLVTRLQVYFRENPDIIPSQVALYFIPTLNPDGKIDGKRFNASGVDLNRNWDTPSWKADTEQPGGTMRNSGGERPFSESETQALRDILQNLQNEGESVTVIAYHYHTGIAGQGTVQPGYQTYYSPVQPSDGLARRLEQLAGYAYLPYWDGSYVPSGELIQWCAINGIAAVDVELPRGVQPDSRPSGQTRTVFEAALVGVTGIFE